MTDQPRTLSSTEFRRVFQRLQVTTTVTVNGHRIGTWHPQPDTYLPAATHTAVSTMTDTRALGGYRPGEPASPNQVEARDPFTEFRPAPKAPAKKR